MTPTDTSSVLLCYQQALDYLFKRTDYERMARVRHHAGAYDLGRMRRLCEALGNPQDKFVSIHVAGTKGKGSVTTMAAHMLAGGGLNVGLYTSPHLADVRERVAVLPAGDARTRMIEPNEFTATMSSILPVIDRLPATDRPTFFELMTALAFVYFADRRVDVAALEVGLGGRLDATNVVRPRVCAITAIGKDHTRQLGDTLELIAAEKAGIIKPGVPVICSPQPAAVEHVIRKIAAERNAPVYFVGQDIELDARLTNHRYPRRWQVTVRCGSRRFGPLVCPLLGRHQATNLAVAIGMINQLAGEQPGEAGTPGAASLPSVDLTGLANGLERTVWPGRLDVRDQRPWLVLDGAHTVESMRAVLATLPETFDYDRLIVVVGCLADKDLPGLMGQLANGPTEVVLTRSDHPHAADPDELARLLAMRAPFVRRHIEPNATAAVDLARLLAGPRDLVLVTGSIYLVGLLARLAGEWVG